MAHQFTYAERQIISVAGDAAYMINRQPWFSELPNDLQMKLYDAHSAYHELFNLAFDNKADEDD